MLLSSAKQRQRLGFFRKLLCLSEDLYRELLSQFGVETSKNLTSQQIEELTSRLRKNAEARGLYKPKPSFIKYKYNNLGEREGMATPAQLRKIDIMWRNVSRQTNDIDREKALQVMIKKITGKDNIKFLTPVDVRKVINAFQNLREWWDYGLITIEIYSVENDKYLQLYEDILWDYYKPLLGRQGKK